MAKHNDPDRHHRCSIRLPGYDYRQAGAYFVTICTRGRECILNDPVVEDIVTDVWHSLPARFPTIALDEFVVMPNHVHLIVWLRAADVLAADAEPAVGATLAVAPQSTVGATLAVAPDRAGASPAPTTNAPVPPTTVGATLAVAPQSTVGATLAVAPDRAGASPAPTTTTNAVATSRDWIIPEPQAVNMQPTLGGVMGAFKSLVFTVYLDWIQNHGFDRQAKFWQRNYFEHIIRNERELNAIRQYIIDNPDRWAWDTYNPSAVDPDPRAVDLWRMLREDSG